MHVSRATIHFQDEEVIEVQWDNWMYLVIGSTSTCENELFYFPSLVR